MKGYSYDDVQNQSRGAGAWCRLKTGEEVKVVFLLDPGDKDLGVVFYRRHSWDGKTYPLCTRGPKDPVETCDYCSKADPVSWRMRVTVYNIEARKRQRLDGMPAMWFEDMKDAFKYADPDKTVFAISRKGEKAQTRRPIHAAGQIPADVAEEVALLSPFTKVDLLPEGGSQDNPADDAPPPDDEPPF
jgi:hypothetical protein